jgi:pimeloyl-ACP methyl ester carboxylesterase
LVKSIREASVRITGCRVAVVVAAVAFAMPPPAPADASDAGSANCRAVELPVSFDQTAAVLSGDVCHPAHPVVALRRTVQVLVSGTAYGKEYWDFPYQPDTYSYVRAANAAGFTTFNFDRLGIGRSSHPVSPQVTIPSNADSIHQAIQRLRSGAVDGVRYERVVLVGHSLGSLITWYEAAQFHDVDAVVSSGILHTFDRQAVARFAATLYPAAFDPRFAGRISDPGYLTTLPGTRAQSLYYLPNADPQVIEIDERSKQTATAFEARDVFEQETPGTLGALRDPLCAAPAAVCEGSAAFWYGVTTRIAVPVLTVIGQYDNLLCGAGRPNRCADVAKLRQDESQYFRGSAQRCLALLEVPDTGHDLNLHRSAQGWFAPANSWAAAAAARSAVTPNAPCPAGRPTSASVR